MIVETSAMIAILCDEHGGDRCGKAPAGTAETLISAGTYIETAIVVDSNRDPILSRKPNDLLTVTRVKIEQVTKRHAEIARQAYGDFGKDGGHPSALNFGDCFAYSLSVVTGELLLFKEEDFTHSGIKPASRREQ